MDWENWSSVYFNERSLLPHKPGIYLVVDSHGQVWYVGKSDNLHSRWAGKGHHRYDQLRRTQAKRSYKIYWKIYPSLALKERENFYIQLLDPHLNYKKITTYPRRDKSPKEEIQRILRVLNQANKHFSKLRSVILGYYNIIEEEIDNNGENYLVSYTCIVIVIKTHDLKHFIFPNIQRSLQKMKKKQAFTADWSFYESNCGREDYLYNHSIIPIYMVNDVVYEFICFPGLIDLLEDDLSLISKIEYQNQMVTTLVDLHGLEALLIKAKKISHDNEDYLFYRFRDLNPIVDLIASSQ